MTRKVPSQWEQLTRARERDEDEQQVEFLVPLFLSVILGGILGAVVYAVAALLHAPRSVSLGAAGVAFGVVAPFLIQRAIRRRPDWIDRGLEDDDLGRGGSRGLPNEEL